MVLALVSAPDTRLPEEAVPFHHPLMSVPAAVKLAELQKIDAGLLTIDGEEVEVDELAAQLDPNTGLGSQGNDDRLGVDGASVLGSGGSGINTTVGDVGLHHVDRQGGLHR